MKSEDSTWASGLNAEHVDGAMELSIAVELFKVVLSTFDLLERKPCVVFFSLFIKCPHIHTMRNKGETPRKRFTMPTVVICAQNVEPALEDSWGVDEWRTKSCESGEGGQGEGERWRGRAPRGENTGCVEVHSARDR